MRYSAVIGACFFLSVGPARAQLDTIRLAEVYKEYDAQENGDVGRSDSANSGTLGWAEGKILENYAAMWEATEDAYWLGKIRDHFRRIMTSASDLDGDGYRSWTTTSYSCAVASAERLHNVSDAQITPDRQKVLNGKKAALCTGQTYIIEFPVGPDEFRILRWETRDTLVDRTPAKMADRLNAVAPFRFKISGRPHQGDRFLIRTTAPEPIEFTVHQGMFVYPVARFITAVRSRPELTSQFGADAKSFLAFINKHIFAKNEQDWLDLGEAGGGYRFEPKLTDRYPNRIMPHNQYATLARAWLVLKDFDDAHPLMAPRAEQMTRYFHRHLERDDANQAYRWHYWDWTEYGQPGNSGYEDSGHARLNVGLAIEAARQGVIFTDPDMQRFANTWLKVMWNQDEREPRMAAFVDGRGPHDDLPLAMGWCQLSQWNAQVFDLAMSAFRSLDEARQAPYIPSILLSAKRGRPQLLPRHTK